MKIVYLIEIFRYGDISKPEIFGIFTDDVNIHELMSDYNQYRGCKYPSYRVTPIKTGTIIFSQKRGPVINLKS